jgi:hypothetical protein
MVLCSHRCSRSPSRPNHRGSAHPFFTKDSHLYPNIPGTSSLAEPRRRLMTPFVGTLLLLLLSPVSSRTFRASKRNSPPGAPAHTHRIAILELDVPLLEHINTDKTTSTEEGREGYTLPCPTQLYLHSPLLRASASNFFRLNCRT